MTEQFDPYPQPPAPSHTLPEPKSKSKIVISHKPPALMEIDTRATADFDFGIREEPEATSTPQAKSTLVQSTTLADFDFALTFSKSTMEGL
jgi:hypothetical protein